VVLAHPFLFALLLAVLELVAGICTVIGLASRLAAGVGLGLSLAFFFTAGWQVRPFFYGADLPFAAGWLTLLLAGHGGLPSVDATLLRRYRSERGLAAAGKAAGMALATLAAAGAAPLVAGREEPHAAGQRSGRQRVGYLWEVPVGQAELFELPRSREPAIMVRLAKDQLVAYRAICTHARCLVGFDPNSRLIVCACHGAEFDPRRGAAVVAGPAPRPLPRVELRVDDDAVYVQG
jgi:thiosulfate dehydrogenase [quinone] large subunit